MDRKVNDYSATWFEVFLSNQDARKTASEVAFLSDVMPKPDGSQVLDVCCGYGRHAIPLGDYGHTVLGIDRDPDVIQRAESLSNKDNVTFRTHDMRQLDDLPEEFDSVICMWQSFGYFDAATNTDILRTMRGRLRPGGRIVLDIYNRDFFEDRQGTYTVTAGETQVTTRQHLDGDRLTVELEYVERNEREGFDWQVFSPQSICALADHLGLTNVVSCSEFNLQTVPTSGSPRMQHVFRKR